jgi:hypothetical protein
VTWLNVLPEDLQLGDVWGEYGELVEIEQNQHERSWHVYFRTSDNKGYREENFWPADSPIRVLR